MSVIKRFKTFITVLNLQLNAFSIISDYQNIFSKTAKNTLTVMVIFAMFLYLFAIEEIKTVVYN